MYCSKCGTKNDNNSSYCSDCGEKLSSSRPTKLCDFCKKEIDAEAKICPYCRKSKDQRIVEIIFGIFLLIIGISLIIAGQEKTDNNDSNNEDQNSSTIKIDLYK